MQVFIDKREQFPETKYIVYNNFFNELFCATSKRVFCYLPGQFLLYSTNRNLKYCLKENSFIVKILSLIPILGYFIECPFYLYKNGILIGKTRRRYACYEIVINSVKYSIRLHTGCKISFWISNEQAGILRRIETSESMSESYEVLFSNNFEIELVALFGIFASEVFLNDYGMPNVIYTYVPFDKYKFDEWKPID